MQLRALLYQLFSLWLFVLPLLLPAQTFRFTQFTTHNGLPIDNVYAAAQDSNSFLWFGTDFGIARFDGNRFDNYYKTNGLLNKAVTDIVYAGGDSLIFFSYPSAIQSIHYNGKINTIVERSLVSLQQLTRHEDAFYCYNRNTVHFGLLQNGKYKLINVDSMFNSKGLVVHAIVSLSENGVGFCTNKGLLIKNKGQITQLLPGQNVQFIVYTTQKKIVAVSNGYVVESDEKFNFRQLPFSFPENFSVYHMAVETDGAVWFRGLDKGVYRLKDNRLEEMSPRLTLQNKAVNEFFTDLSGNLWFCTDGSGILLKRRSLFQNFETEDGLINNKVLKLIKQKDDLLIGTSNGLCIKKGNQFEQIKLPANSSALNYIFGLFPVNEGLTGICLANSPLYGNNFSWPLGMIKDLQFNDHPLRFFNAMFAWQQDRDNYWIVATKYLVHLSGDLKKTNSLNLENFGVKKLYSMIKFENALWAGSNNGILLITKDKVIKIDSIEKEKLGQVFDFLIDKKNRLWIATETGLFIHENKKFKAVQKGISMGSNYCTGITEDDKGMIWCSTWDGIFETDGIEKKSYNTSDGLPSKTANCVLFDEVTKQLYIGTDNGLSVCNKNSLTTINLYPHVFIKCGIEDTLLVVENSTLAPGQNKLNFYLSLPFFEGNDNIMYEYKMDNNSWTQAINPNVIISGISSGKHNFYARAKINGQLFIREDANFAFTIEKHFYESWWFIAGIFILSQLAIIYIINRYNKNAKEKKLAEQLHQARYASLKQQAFTSLMNPHFIFNALNSVQHYINQQDRQSANKYLSDFATLVRKSFDTSQRSFVSLEEELETVRLYLQLEKMRFADKFDYLITLSKEVEDDEWMLPSMVLQPFLENAILHGLMPLNSKGLITIDARVKNDTLHITITDNGIGIEKSKIYRSGKEHKSRGMQLIKERLELLSKLSKEPIELAITALNPGDENPGTKISLNVPQSVYEAFTKQAGKG